MRTITLSDNELDVIMQALGELPLKVSGPVFTRIQQQVLSPPPSILPADHADTNAA